MQSVIVLGAGMVGVSTALHLRRRGLDVILVDRRGPGEETSHGNAGIVQSEAVEPTPMPRDFLSLARVALGLSNDVRYSVSTLPEHARPLALYWWNSAPKRHQAIAKHYAALIEHAISEHQTLIAEAGAESLVRRNGYFLVHRSAASYAEAVAKAERVGRTYGVPYKLLSPAEVRAQEPAITGDFVGAIHWTDPWSIADPGRLAKLYADVFVREGGEIALGDAMTLKQTSSGWSVMTASGLIEAAAAVVALGPWSPKLLEPFGYRFDMARKRGYHQHYAGGAKVDRPVFDAAFGYVLAPMARGLRITTGAEFTGYDAPATPVQLGRAEAAARELLDLGSAVDPAPWFGTRPFLSGMLPAIGPAPKHKGLWFNFGHGHQGFTLGPASGRLMAEIMTGNGNPMIDPAPYDPAGIVRR